jgi:antitoxin ParD1/3/4
LSIRAGTGGLWAQLIVPPSRFASRGDARIAGRAPAEAHGIIYGILAIQPQGSSIMATLNISIPDSMREWIDAQVTAGGYANASDYIRDLVRHNQRERESIQLALIEGERSGVSERSVSDIAQQARRRLQRAKV